MAGAGGRHSGDLGQCDACSGAASDRSPVRRPTAAGAEICVRRWQPAHGVRQRNDAAGGTYSVALAASALQLWGLDVGRHPHPMQERQSNAGAKSLALFGVDGADSTERKFFEVSRVTGEHAHDQK